MRKLVEKYGGAVNMKPAYYSKTIRQAKQRMNLLERFMALSPDSLNIQTTSDQPNGAGSAGSIDSFYCNKNKIDYIAANKISSPTIHFYSR